MSFLMQKKITKVNCSPIKIFMKLNSTHINWIKLSKFFLTLLHLAQLNITLLHMDLCSWSESLIYQNQNKQDQRSEQILPLTLDKLSGNTSTGIREIYKHYRRSTQIFAKLRRVGYSKMKYNLYWIELELKCADHLT